MSAARELGYTPNQAARALATGRSRVVAVQTFDFRNSYSGQITDTLQQILGQDGYEVITTMVHRDMDAVTAHVDGIVALDYSPLVDMSHVQGPYVSLGVFAPPDQDASLIDFRPAASAALARMHRSGRHRIAYVTGEDVLHGTDPREEAYLEFCRQSGVTPQVFVLPKDDRESGYSVCLRRLQTSPRPNALFCRNDAIALGCLRAIRELGLLCPQDVMVCGCDGTDDSLYTSPALSTLAAPFDLVCQSAWLLLKARMEDPAAPARHLTHPARFEPRGTT